MFWMATGQKTKSIIYPYFLNIASALMHRFPLRTQTLNKLQSNSMQFTQAGWWSTTSYYDIRNRNLFSIGTGHFKDPCRRAMHYSDGEDNCLFYQSQNIGEQSSMKIR